MSERVDIAIRILDNTEDLIEQINNQHNFEEDLSNFLNTNTYSKGKKWVFGMSNMVSDCCKNEINTIFQYILLSFKRQFIPNEQLVEKNEEIIQLKEDLNNN